MLKSIASRMNAASTRFESLLNVYITCHPHPIKALDVAGCHYRGIRSSHNAFQEMATIAFRSVNDWNERKRMIREFLAMHCDYVELDAIEMVIMYFSRYVIDLEELCAEVFKPSRVAYSISLEPEEWL